MAVLAEVTSTVVVEEIVIAQTSINQRDLEYKNYQNLVGYSTTN